MSRFIVFQRSLKISPNRLKLINHSNFPLLSPLMCSEIFLLQFKKKTSRISSENVASCRWQMRRFWNSQKCCISDRQGDSRTCGAPRWIRFGPGGRMRAPTAGSFSSDACLCAEFGLSGIHRDVIWHFNLDRFYINKASVSSKLNQKLLRKISNDCKNIITGSYKFATEKERYLFFFTSSVIVMFYITPLTFHLARL